ncbi:GNAT family N-acetyltransferase [Rhizobiales bacterium]|nr:GNAT family N-acetyltransferase [Hongsoonwoonella zoysiae]
MGGGAMTVEYRRMTRADLNLAIDWAASEGWNPGQDDGDPFFAADRSGFHMATMDGEPAAVISAVRYGKTYAFIGFYIARPEHRGKGIGRGLWSYAMETLKDRVIGLDGVVEQQGNYAKSGFELAHRNIRMSGISITDTPMDPRISMIGRGLYPSVRDYDRPFFPDDREAFLAAWLMPEENRRGFALVEDGEVRGYGVIRACLDGFKIGPLFADTEAVADTLFRALAGMVRGQEVTLDIPETNRAAEALAERYELSPVFETARMYRGPRPDLPLKRTFGITTFELG